MVAFSKLLAPPSRSVDPAQKRPGTPHMRLTSDAFNGRLDTQADDKPPVLGRIGRDSDRRVFPRQSLGLHVSGRRMDHSVDARREPCLHLALKDVSVGGMCATSQTPVRVGEHIAVFFPPEGYSRGWDAYGRVLRVEPAKTGYQIAVSFDRLPAA